jgi:signal transduction histidine kinase
MKKNAETVAWSLSYQAALRRHLKQGQAASMRPALRLGRQAVGLGLETLDLAKFHEQALLKVMSQDVASENQQSLIERATRFFAEATVPIEKTHHAALKADLRLHELTATLQQRTAEATASDQNLGRSVIQRQAAEAAFEKSGKRQVKLLKESGRLQTSIQNRTHAILSAQEDERQKTSRQLQDEIAQTLLAINIRLLALKTSAKANTDKLSKEIANTQRLVRKSAQKINRFRP